MIDFNELKVGNYIKYTQQNFIGNAMTISESIDTITKVEKQVITVKSGFNLDFNIVKNYIYPVPLTEKILLDCGFNKMPDKTENSFVFYELTCNDISKNSPFTIIILLSKVNGAFYFAISNQFAYLHNLQNLYNYITGQDLRVVI